MAFRKLRGRLACALMAQPNKPQDEWIRSEKKMAFNWNSKAYDMWSKGRERAVRLAARASSVEEDGEPD